MFNPFKRREKEHPVADTKIQLTQNHDLKDFKNVMVVTCAGAGTNAWIKRNLCLGKSNFILTSEDNNRFDAAFEVLKELGYTIHHVSVSLNDAFKPVNMDLVKTYATEVATKEKYGLVFDADHGVVQKTNAVTQYIHKIIEPILMGKPLTQDTKPDLPHVEVYLTEDMAMQIPNICDYAYVTKKYQVSFIFIYNHVQNNALSLQTFQSLCNSSVILFMGCRDKLLLFYLYDLFRQKLASVLKKNESLLTFPVNDAIIFDMETNIYRDQKFSQSDIQKM